eukprot:jgi/Tetstr1/463520/TSEL_008399.t1
MPRNRATCIATLWLAIFRDTELRERELRAVWRTRLCVRREDIPCACAAAASAGLEGLRGLRLGGLEEADLEAFVVQGGEQAIDAASAAVGDGGVEEALVDDGLRDLLVADLTTGPTCAASNAFASNVHKRGAVPPTRAARREDGTGAGPVMVAFFLFVVVGSAVLQVISTASSGPRF